MVIGVTHHFVDGCGTEALTRIAILFCTPRRAHVRVKHVQVCRLIFIMSHGCVIYVGNFVEGERAVKSKILVTLGRFVSAITVGRKFLHRFVARFLMVTIKNSPRSTAGYVLQAGVGHSQPTTMSKSCMKISILAQLGSNPTIFHTTLVTLQFLC